MLKLSMKLCKCHFFAKEIKYLGHILSATGIKLLPWKIEAIKVMKPLRNAKQEWAFPGLMGYCWKFIKNLLMANH